MEHALFVAESEGQPVARCAAMIDRAWQASQGADTTGSTNSVKAAIPAVGVNDTSGAPTRTHRAPADVDHVLCAPDICLPLR